MLKRLNSYSLAAPLPKSTDRVSCEATFRADDGADRPVLLDVVRTGLAMTDGMRDRFIEDAQAASQLAHENVVPVLDHGFAEGYAYVVHEPGISRTLAELIADAPEGRLSAELVALIGADIVAGLDHAHRRRPPLVHGAVSPSSIRVYADGHARLGSFAAFALWRSLAHAGATVGEETAYFSPHRAQDRPLSESSDLFSLGSSLYEALTGQRAFDGPTPLATMLKIRLGTFESLETVARDAPEPLRRAIESLLSVKPSPPATLESINGLLSTGASDPVGLRAALRDRVPPPTRAVSPAPPPPATAAPKPTEAPAPAIESVSSYDEAADPGLYSKAEPTMMDLQDGQGVDAAPARMSSSAAPEPPSIDPEELRPTTVMEATALPAEFYSDDPGPPPPVAAPPLRPTESLPAHAEGFDDGEDAWHERPASRLVALIVSAVVVMALTALLTAWFSG